jgi:hypothetical protein
VKLICVKKSKLTKIIIKNSNRQKFIIVFAFVALIAAVSCDVSHLATKGPDGYRYPVPEGPKLDEIPTNDLVPPTDESSSTPAAPSNEYLPAAPADTPTNDYLPPQSDAILADEPLADEPETTEATIEN